MVSLARLALVTSASCLVVAALVRCSSFSGDSTSVADAASEAAPLDGPADRDGGLTDAADPDAADPDACVPLLTDEFQRPFPFGAPWDTFFSAGAAQATIIKFDGGVQGLFVDVPAPAGGYLLVKALPDEAARAELEYDTGVLIGGDAGGPDGGQVWGVAFPEILVDELDASVALGTSLYMGQWLVDGARNFHGDASADTSKYAPITPIVDPVHVRLVATFGSAGAIEATITSGNGVVQTQRVPFPSGPGAKRVGVGVTSGGASPHAQAAFAHVRACWR
jgi:hypothetical protein